MKDETLTLEVYFLTHLFVNLSDHETKFFHTLTELGKNGFLRFFQFSVNVLSPYSLTNLSVHVTLKCFNRDRQLRILNLVCKQRYSALGVFFRSKFNPVH